ncbi:peptidylprolyl isomerase fpr4 [Dissophora globulifera]|nr:peptidylprolyl isomerase fpr4 [Dissophora globulifera]
MAALDEDTKPCRSSVRVTVDKKTFILCSLIAGKVEQQTLDLVFTEGESITFSVSGENAVHLSGNYLPEDEEMDYDSDEEDMYGDEDEEDMDEDEDEEDDDENEEVIVTKGAKRIAKFEEEPTKKQAVPEKKQKVSEEKAVPVKKDAPAKKEAPAKKDAAKKEEATKKDAAKKEGADKKDAAKKDAAKKDAPKKEEPKKDNKKVLANGLIIEDVKVGTGQAAKSGKKIGMRYIGRLTNGKVFDKNTNGAPFNFNLGRGEVIKGWDLGIQGMQLGGERRLTIPPALAYGSQGAPPDIPRNATLVFEVKLVTLK